MENYQYTPYAKAFYAVFFFRNKPDGTPWSDAERAAKKNKKGFDGKYDSYKTEKGQFIHSDEKGLRELMKMVTNWKDNILGGYIKTRDGVQIYTWGQDCILIQHGIPNWEYKDAVHSDHKHKYLKSVTPVRDARLPEVAKLPIQATTLDTQQFEQVKKDKSTLIAQITKEHSERKQLTRKEEWEMRWYGKILTEKK